MIKTKFIYLILLISLFACSVNKVQSQATYAIDYSLRMPEPATHYFEVEMRVNNVLTNPLIRDKNKLEVKMPVWTPGSYLVREFARNIHRIEAKNEKGQVLRIRKTNKNTWEIETEQSNEVTVSYTLYANELSVRTSFLDAAHGYVNGASVFLFVPQLVNSESRLNVIPFNEWKTISTALPVLGNNTFLVKDYDTLVDSPIEIGNHEVLEFVAAGVPHKIAMFSTEPLKYDKSKLLADYKKLVEAATSVVGETPLDHYLFIIHHQQGIGGGLEHLFSSTCHTSPQAYDNQANYLGFFSLLAHEYFHLWNVKRIRPVALGPFDYENENYTNMLWVAEGLTNYYEEIILSRAGIQTEEDVLNNLSQNMNAVLNTPGNYVQSATEASWDAWIKYYRQDENSSNSGISYYSKGGLLGSALNAIIIAETKAEKSLDDVMRLLYKKYYKELGRGYTDEEFQYACEEIAGKSLNEFFSQYVSGIDTPDYKSIFAGVGINLEETKASETTGYLGVTEVGRTVYSLNSKAAAYTSGLNVGDRVLSVNGKAGTTLTDAAIGKSAGETLEVKIERSGVPMTLTITIGNDYRKNYSMSKIKSLSAVQKKSYQKFVKE
jgi:predicted metalloprotease with PDZ domain